MKSLEDIRAIPDPTPVLRTHDSRGHRLRGVYVPHNKNIVPNETDIFDMEMRHRHGNLTTEASNAFRDGEQTATNRRLRMMAHAPILDGRGPYVHQCPQQFGSVVARSNRLVYGNTHWGEQVLMERGLYREFHPKPKQNREWKHDFMGSCRTSSIHLAIRSAPHYTYIFHDQIAEYAGTDTFECPYHFSKNKGKGERVFIKDGKLKPDPMSGIRYPNGSSLILLPEDDCKTERLYSDKIDVEVWQHKLEKHYAFVGERQRNGSKLYYQYFEPKQRLMSAFVFSDIGRMKAVMEMLYEMTEGRGSRFMLFQSWTNFGTILKVPSIRFDLFDGLWYRVGHEPLNISKVDGGVKE